MAMQSLATKERFRVSDVDADGIEMIKKGAKTVWQQSPMSIINGK